MSEEYLSKINNHLNQKQISYYEIFGKVDNNGELVENFNEKQEFDSAYDFKVSLISIEAPSFFANIVKDINDTFYYSKPGETDIKQIRFDSGSYDIQDLNTIIVDHFYDSTKKEQSSPIILQLSNGTGKTIIKLATGYKVYFNQAKDFRKILGYETDTILDKAVNISPEMCSVVDTSNIFIKCDKILGCWYKGTQSTILYSFSNEVRWGAPINIRPKHKEEHQLINKSFNSIKIKFENQDGKPVTFMNNEVLIKIEIRQV